MNKNLRTKHKDFFRILIACIIITLIFAYQFFDKVVLPLEPINENYTSIVVSFIMLYALSLLSFIAVYLFIAKAKMAKSWVLFFSILFLGIISIFVSPPYTVPDEPAHIETSYKYSNVILGIEKEIKSQSLIIRKGDLSGFQYLDKRPNQDIYRNVYSSLDFIADKTEKEHIAIDAVIVKNGFAAYLPQALGITLARLLSLGFTPLIYFGSIFNLLFYAFCFYFAFKLLPFGKNILAAVAFLPICVHLSGSFSYDLTIIGLSILVFSYVMNLIYIKDVVSVWDYVSLALLVFFLAPCKVVYYPLAFLTLLVPVSKFKKPGNKRWFALIVICAGLLSLIIFKRDYFLSMFQKSIQPGSISSSVIVEQEKYTLSWVLANPFNELRMLINTTRDTAAWYWEMMVGAYLGWQEININLVWIYAYTVIIGLSVLIKEEDDKEIPKRYRFAFLLIAGMIYVLITLALQLAHTPTSFRDIVGVQGRYFIPMLPMILFAVKGNLAKANKHFSNHLFFGMIVINIMVLLNTYMIFITR